MGDELPEQPIAEGIEQSGTEGEELVVSGQGADLAAVLAGRALGDAVPGPSQRREEHAVAREHDLHGHGHVVEDRPRIEAREQRLADRIERARDPHRGVEPALRVAHALLVGPVEANPLSGSPRSGDEMQLAAHRAHRGVCEKGHQLAHGVPGQGLSRVGEDQDLAVRGRHRLVEGRRLAAGSGQGEQPHPLRREAGRDGFRAVRRAVGGDDHLEAVPRVVEVEQVAELLLEAVLFVPHHGEEAHGRRAVPLADLGGRSQARRQPDQRGIAQVRIEDDRGGEPERDLHRGTLTQARGAPPGFDPGPRGRYAFGRPLTCTAAGNERGRLAAPMERGRVVARILAGAWRASPPPLDLSRAQLVAAAPLLLASGAAGLAWWRLRGSSLSEGAEEAGLRRAYRLHTLEAAVHRLRILEASRAFHAAGMDPVLVKGWAVARLYPEEGLRPYTDLDLHVRGEDAASAGAIALGLARRGCPVDLHRGWGRLDDRATGELLERSARVAIEDGAIRVLGLEDHLRLLCLHMLGHGAWRPLWLADLGVVLESPPSGFDWDRLLWGEPRRSEWVSSATPQGARRPLADYVWRPAGWLHALRIRWPNPIEATVGVGASFDEMPRLPFQIGECLSRAARFALEMMARPRAHVR